MFGSRRARIDRAVAALPNDTVLLARMKNWRDHRQLRLAAIAK